jgi:hypothetical protein
MNTLARLVLALLFTPIVAPADVLIYRGTYKAYSPSLKATDAPSQKVYVVLGDGMDGGTYEVVILHYGKRGSVKKVVQEEKRLALLKTFTATNGKAYSAITYAEFVNGVFALRSSAIFMRGKDTTLTLSNAPVVTRSFPRTMSGIFRESIESAVGGAAYRDANFNIAFDDGRTLTANNANKTIDAAATDLMAELNAAGFVSE